MDLPRLTRQPADPVAQIASKLSHGVALLLTDLSKEPAKGLLQIVNHTQASVPSLLQLQDRISSSQQQLQLLLEEVEDIQAGVDAAVSPVLQQELDSVLTACAELRPPTLHQLPPMPGLQVAADAEAGGHRQQTGQAAGDVTDTAAAAADPAGGGNKEDLGPHPSAGSVSSVVVSGAAAVGVRGLVGRMRDSFTRGSAKPPQLEQ